ncbi:MAG TPA: hypothetical protein VJN96_03290 [Vicinamibacterales bacterium]|nr:hypothetical protein [Vicinamibacterales bacterium]
MKRRATVLGVAISLWATAALAQNRNFAGNWIVDSERSPGGIQARSGAVGYEPGVTPPLAIAMDSTTITVGSSTYKLNDTVKFEGTAGTATAKTSWKGDKLVIERTDPGGRPAVTTTTFYLDGTSLVRELSFVARDGGEPRVIKTYYKRS